MGQRVSWCLNPAGPPVHSVLAVPDSRRNKWSESLKSASLLRLFCESCRRDKNKRRAQEVSQQLRDNRDLQHFLQNTQDVSSSLFIR